MMQRPDYMQVVSDRPNVRFYHVVNQPPPPPPILRQHHPQPVVHSLFPLQTMNPPTIEKIQDALGPEFYDSHKSQVSDEIANLRRELKKDIADIHQSIELLKQAQCCGGGGCGGGGGGDSTSAENTNKAN